MKVLMINLRYTFLFAFVVFFSHLSFANELTSPESTVYDFYTVYLKDDSVDNAALNNKYVSDELMKSVNDSTMCNYDSDDSVTEAELEKKCTLKHECKQYKGNYICEWYGIWVESDVNYFTKSQDVYPSWQSNIKTSAIAQDVNNSVVGLILGDDSGPKNKLTVSLKKEKGRWKIISVTE